jgi:hypothetical protein
MVLNEDAVPKSYWEPGEPRLRRQVLARISKAVPRWDGSTVIREGHGTGEGRGTSPGEVHDIALKAAETDATKRALATFGRPFGLELYRGGKGTAAQRRPLPAPPSVPAPADSRVGFHPDDTTPIPRPSRYYGRRQNELAEHFRGERRRAEWAMGMLPVHAPRAPAPSASAPPLAPDAQPDPLRGRIDKSQLAIAEPKRLRDKGHLRFVASQPCLICGRQPSDPHHLRLCPTQSHRSQSQRRVHRTPVPWSSPTAASGRQ